MICQTLTLKSIQARPVVLKLKRPVVARIATLTDWPLILIDLYTEEGVIGRAYLEPYILKSMRYLIPALHDLGEMLKGRRLAPVELYDAARKSLHFVGYEGMSMIAVAGVDMAAWDALARAAVVPVFSTMPGSKETAPFPDSPAKVCSRRFSARLGPPWTRSCSLLANVAGGESPLRTRL